MKIRSHFIEFLPLYGHTKNPENLHFFLYFVQFNASGFQNKNYLPQNMVFFNFIGSILTEYGKKKNLQKHLPV